MKIDASRLALKCFPPELRDDDRGHESDEPLSVCLLCFATVPMGDCPPEHLTAPIPRLEGLGTIQSGHVLWHVIVLEGLHE